MPESSAFGSMPTPYPVPARANARATQASPRFVDQIALTTEPHFASVFTDNGSSAGRAAHPKHQQPHARAGSANGDGSRLLGYAGRGGHHLAALAGVADRAAATAPAHDMPYHRPPPVLAAAPADTHAGAGAAHADVHAGGAAAHAGVHAGGGPEPPRGLEQPAGAATAAPQFRGVSDVLGRYGAAHLRGVRPDPPAHSPRAAAHGQDVWRDNNSDDETDKTKIQSLHGSGVGDRRGIRIHITSMHVWERERAHEGFWCCVEHKISLHMHVKEKREEGSQRETYATFVLFALLLSAFRTSSIS